MANGNVERAIKTVDWHQIGGSDFPDGHFHHVPLKKYYSINQLEKTQHCPRTLSAAPPPINIVGERVGEGEGALSRASHPMPAACAGWSLARSQLCCCRGPVGGGGGRRRVLLSTTAAVPVSLSTNARSTPSCTIWAINSSCGHCCLGTRRAPLKNE